MSSLVRPVPTAAMGYAAPASPFPPLITFIEPMAGFETECLFTLSRIDDAGMLVSLRSQRDPELRFVLTPAQVFFGDYAASLLPVVSGPVTDALGGAGSITALDLYLVLTVGGSLADTTANLRAPLVIERGSGQAVQVILDDTELPMRQPLTAAA